MNELGKTQKKIEEGSPLLDEISLDVQEAKNCKDKKIFSGYDQSLDKIIKERSSIFTRRINKEIGYIGDFKIILNHSYV